MHLIDVMSSLLCGNGSLYDGVSISDQVVPKVAIGLVKVESVLGLDISNNGNRGLGDDGHC